MHPSTMKFLRRRLREDPLFLRPLVLLLFLLPAGSAGALHPLAPLDTSSPRATFESFLALTEGLTRAYAEYRDSPGPATHRAF